MPGSRWTSALVLALGATMGAGCSASPRALPTPTATPATLTPDSTGLASTRWPDASSTGWARTGAGLTAYTGKTFLKDAGTVRIDRKIVDYIQAYGNTSVVVTRSQINGMLDINAPATLTIEDSNVDAGATSSGAISGSNITASRVNVTGGQHSVHCQRACVIEDSWLHDQSLPSNEPRHNNGFISNGGSDMVIRHNTISCDPHNNAVDGGCTADLSLFGDFSPITDVTIENNHFRATPGGWCGSFGHNPQKPYGSASAGVVVRGNVFDRGDNGKCGAFGAATSYRFDGPGNIWEDNTWDDGTPVEP